MEGQYFATSSYPMNLPQNKAMGSDTDVPCMKGRLEYNSALEKCVCLAVEKRTSTRHMGKSGTF